MICPPRWGLNPRTYETRRGEQKDQRTETDVSVYRLRATFRIRDWSRGERVRLSKIVREDIDTDIRELRDGLSHVAEAKR